MDREYLIKKDLFTPHYHSTVYPATDPANPSNSLVGKAAIVTGAARGIGSAISTSLLTAGLSTLIIVGRTTSALEIFKSELEATYPSATIFAHTTDISSLDSVKSFYSTIATTFPGASYPNILINNAGIYSTPTGAIGKHAEETWFDDWEVNVKGSYIMSSLFLRGLEEAGRVAEATIIGFSSITNLVANNAAYFGSKLAIAKMMEYVEEERGKEGVASYAVHPGIVDTDLLPERLQIFAVDKPELVAGLIAWLSAKRPQFLRGRWVSANWDVEDLEKREAEIVKDDLLKLKLRGKFGIEQFQSTL